MGSWEVLISEDVEDWLQKMTAADPDTARQVRAAIRVLATDGPALGRPLVDTVKGSSIKNLKELRPGSSGRTQIGSCLFSTLSGRQYC